MAADILIPKLHGEWFTLKPVRLKAANQCNSCHFYLWVALVQFGDLPTDHYVDPFRPSAISPNCPNGNRNKLPQSALGLQKGACYLWRTVSPLADLIVSPRSDPRAQPGLEYDVIGPGPTLLHFDAM